MSLDYLPLSYRRRLHVDGQRLARARPVRPPELGETPLSPAEVQHGISRGILRARISDYSDYPDTGNRRGVDI